MPGLIAILATSPFPPVRIIMCSGASEVMARNLRPAYSADIGARDPDDVEAHVRRRLPPMTPAGTIPANLDMAIRAIADAFVAVPAVLAPPEPEIAAGDSLRGAGTAPAREDRQQGSAAAPPARQGNEPEKDRSVPSPRMTNDAISEPRAERVITASGHHCARFAPTRPVTDVKGLRNKLGLSQGKFARAFGFSIQTVQDWEQDRSRPDQAVRSYLQVIEHSPDMVRAALER